MEVVESDFFGDYNKFIGSSEIKNGTCKENNPNELEKIDDVAFHHQTELNKDEPKHKDKEKNKLKHKNSMSGNSSNNLFKVLQKKTNREEDKKTKKKRKTKTDMDITLKNKTEVNYEDKKKENEQKIYEMFNCERDEFYDIYEEQAPSSDIYNMLNEEDGNPEVNRERPIYNTQVNPEIPESFNMIISSNQ